MKALLAILALLALPALAADPFAPNQQSALVVLAALTYDDYAQTMDIKNHWGKYETNVLLGRHPSDARIRNYFVGASLLSVAAIYALPTAHRKWAIGSLMVMEFRVTQHNKRLGLKGAF